MEIELNNKNKTKFEFSYAHGLPYKKAIRPELEYGEWQEEPNKLLFKVILYEREYSLFKNPYDINFHNVYLYGSEIWFDIDDVYLVIPADKLIIKKIKEKNYFLVFIYNDKVLSGFGY